VVVVAVHLAAQQRAAVDEGTVRGLLHRDPERPQPVGHGGDAVGFLHPQFRGTPDPRGAACGRGRDAQRGKLVDHVRHHLGGNVDAAQRRVAHHQVGQRLAEGVGKRHRFDPDVGTHRGQHPQQSGATRMDPDGAQPQP
jgi:hypothetical protein